MLEQVSYARMSNLGELEDLGLLSPPAGRAGGPGSTVAPSWRAWSYCCPHLEKLEDLGLLLPSAGGPGSTVAPQLEELRDLGLLAPPGWRGVFIQPLHWMVEAVQQQLMLRIILIFIFLSVEAPLVSG